MLGRLSPIFGDCPLPLEIARTALPATAHSISSCSAAAPPSATHLGSGASFNAAVSIFRFVESSSAKHWCIVCAEYWLHVVKMSMICARIRSGASFSAASFLLRYSSCMPNARSSKEMMSFCAQSLRPKSPSNVRSKTRGRLGRSIRVIVLMIILVTASQPTFGCLASCCTSLSDATPILTSEVVAVRSTSVGKVCATLMFTSSPDSSGASLETAVWHKSTAVMKTCLSVPTGLANDCWIALHIPAKASA
mmetsp:Transcript_11858/g.26997  ORF Transcript_11858/g.26997 Transcript_11858/m.26997 type:complete len:250 (-) Transcript_11858:4069-4818(-)